MDLHQLQSLPPWEWPEDARDAVLSVLRDEGASDDDRVVAAELGGDLTIVDDELADALLSSAARADRSEAVRSRAAIALGPVLEEADGVGFDDPDGSAISERTFQAIRARLRQLYSDAAVPKEVRHRVLEASVRAPEDWHAGAVRSAYASGDEAWRLTAVFCMRFVRGFDDQILEALGSEDEDIHYQAVLAAGSSEVDGAWPHVAALLEPGRTPKPLLLAAIEAAAAIRPDEARERLEGLVDSDDEEVAAAVEEALAMADLSAAEDEDEEDGDLFR
jgi:hypothetical protein